MVNRVNGNDYYDYSKLKMPDAADKTGNGEKFSLNYQRAQEEKEDEEKKGQADEGKDAKISGGGGQRTVMQSGVRLELSGNVQSASDARRDHVGQTQSAGQGFLDSIRAWISGFTQSLKTFLYKIWNDETPQNVTVEEKVVEDQQSAQVVQEAESVLDAGTVESTDETDRLTEEYLELKKLESLRNPEAAARQQLQREAERDKEIQKYLRSGNLFQTAAIQKPPCSKQPYPRTHSS